MKLDWGHYITMSWEIAFGFAALLILTKILGKTQISQITAFDFISALVLGEMVGNALFDKQAGIPEILVVIVVWGLLMFCAEAITQKFNKSRSFLEGRPAIVVHKGELIREAMKKNKLDVNQLQHLLRQKNAFSLQEVEYGILETDGTLSVLKKSDYQMPTRKDAKLRPAAVNLPFTLIIDGQVIKDNLEELGKTEDWLQTELKKQKYNSVEDVFYAEWTPDQKLLVQDGKGKNKADD